LDIFTHILTENATRLTENVTWGGIIFVPGTDEKFSAGRQTFRSVCMARRVFSNGHFALVNFQQ